MLGRPSRTSGTSATRLPMRHRHWRRVGHAPPWKCRQQGRLEMASSPLLFLAGGDTHRYLQNEETHKQQLILNFLFRSAFNLLFFLSVVRFFFPGGRSVAKGLFGRRLLCSPSCLGRYGRRRAGSAAGRLLWRRLKGTTRLLLETDLCWGTNLHRVYADVEGWPARATVRRRSRGRNNGQIWRWLASGCCLGRCYWRPNGEERVVSSWWLRGRIGAAGLRGEGWPARERALAGGW